MAVSPPSGDVYITNSSSASLTVFDPATGAFSNVGVGANPLGVAIGPDNAYVANSDSDTISVLHL